MIYKGHVIYLEKDYAVVMTDTAEYIKVSAKKCLAVGVHIIFTDEDIVKEKRNTATNTWKYAAACAVILIATVFQLYIGSVSRINNTIAAVVSLDINPSIELEINSRGEVIDYFPLNDDGSAILAAKLEGKPVSTAVCELLENAGAQGYLDNDEKIVLISLSTLLTELNVSLADMEVDILSYINRNSRLAGIDLMFVHCNREMLEEARRNSVSVGRYYMYEKLKELETGITIEKVREMELKRLFYRFRNRQGIENKIETFSENNNDCFVCDAVYEQIQLRYEVRSMEKYRHQIELQNQERNQSTERFRAGKDKESIGYTTADEGTIQNGSQGINGGQNHWEVDSVESKTIQGEVNNRPVQVPDTPGEPHNQEQNYDINIGNSDNKNLDPVITPTTEAPGDNGNNDEDRGPEEGKQKGRSHNDEKGNKK